LSGKSEQLIIYTDGGSRGNPGPAAAAFILMDLAGTQLQARACHLGRTTNNVAEYTGLLKALEAAKQIGAGRLKIFSDSELLVNQINGRYKVKSQQLKPLFQQGLDLLAGFESWEVQFIPRNENKQADKLVNQALNLGQDVVAKPGGKKMSSAQPYTSRTKCRSKPVRLGVLISGGGRTLTNIVEHINSGRLNAKVAVVISSRSTVAGVERAKSAGLAVEIVRKKDFPDIDRFSRCIEEKLAAAKVDLVIQGGWLCLWKIPERYTNRVMNIHPALLPSFGGEGMFGHHVHEAVLEAGCRVSGCTVHFCTNEYDKGPIILQRCCQVEEGDSPETLAARVFEQECIAFPQAIELFAEGKLVVENGKVKIKS
jgi:formyltetrahydrofolate-dependent phosphoribosylglycinamide formyltransferase